MKNNNPLPNTSKSIRKREAHQTSNSFLKRLVPNQLLHTVTRFLVSILKADIPLLRSVLKNMSDVVTEYCQTDGARSLNPAVFNREGANSQLFHQGSVYRYGSVSLDYRVHCFQLYAKISYRNHLHF